MNKILLVFLIFAFVAVNATQVDSEKNTIKCITRCVRKHLKWSAALKLIAKCKTDRNCYLRSVGGKAKECVLGCVGKSNVAEELAAVHATMEIINNKVDELELQKSPIKCVVKCVRKHLSVWKAAKLIGKCKTSRSCYLKSLGGKAKDCAMSCVGKSVDPIEAGLIAMVDNEKSPIKCIVKCVKKHLKWRTALKLIAKCKTDRNCYLRSLGGKAKDCAMGCIGGSMIAVEAPVEKNPIKCIVKCVKKHLKWRTALKLIAKCKTDRNCYLRSLGGKAKDCAMGCIGGKVIASKVVIAEAPVDKSVIKCITGCVRRHLKFRAALKLIAKCKTDRNCYLRSVGGKAKECVLGCVGKSTVAAGSDNVCKKCVKKVVAVKKKFRSLETREEKKAFIKKAFKIFTEKHPEVDKKKIFRFLRFALGKSCPVKVCKLYKKVFKSEDEVSAIVSEIEKNTFKCIGRCVKKHLNIWKALKIIGTCKKDKKCYLSKLKGKAKACVNECL